MQPKQKPPNKRFVIGVDEVGRGCLAGPVVAGAVCFKQAVLPDEKYTDSKLISESKREKYAELIRGRHFFSVAQASAREIDEINILWASLLAMRRAVEDLVRGIPDFTWTEAIVIVDGKFKIPKVDWQQSPMIKADLFVPEVSAASILAKTFRDHFMQALDLEHPEYGLKDNKGYPSPSHKKAIIDHGVREIHRFSFRGVKEQLERDLG